MILSIVLAVAGLSRTATEDVAAMARIARGEHEAVGELYDRHGRLMYSLALRIVRDQGDAEDVVQEAFAQAWRQAAQFDAKRGNVAAWLVMLTRARGLDVLRRRRVRPPLQAQDNPVESPDHSPMPDEQLAWLARAADVQRALEALPLLQRVAVELAYFDGLTQTEIAEQLEVPLGTVKTRVRQALLRLRDHFAGAAR